MRTRLLAALALAAASIPAAPVEADAATRLFCRAYCETINIVCQAGATLAGNEGACEPLYHGCLDGCSVPR